MKSKLNFDIGKSNNYQPVEMKEIAKHLTNKATLRLI